MMDAMSIETKRRKRGPEAKRLGSNQSLFPNDAPPFHHVVWPVTPLVTSSRMTSPLLRMLSPSPTESIRKSRTASVHPIRARLGTSQDGRSIDLLFRRCRLRSFFLLQTCFSIGSRIPLSIAVAAGCCFLPIPYLLFLLYCTVLNQSWRLVALLKTRTKLESFRP